MELNKEIAAKKPVQSPAQSPAKAAENDGPENFLSGLPAELVEAISPAKMRMILLWLTGQYTQKKIAAVVGVAEQTINIWLRDPTVQAIIKELQAREFAIVESNLKAMRYKALQTLDDLLDSDMDNVRFQAAKDILDRGGHKPQQNIKVDKTVTTVEQQLASLADFTIDDAEIIDIDIDDLVAEAKEN